jgi:hypothetical protein
MTCAYCGTQVAPARTGRPRKYCDSAECRRAAAAAWQRKARERKPPATTVTFGTNADLFATVSDLYLTAGDVVADVTYSSGRFWQKVDIRRYKFLASDLLAQRNSRVSVLGCDFRQLPYVAASIDTLVFDPPYIHAPGKGMLKDRYNGLATTDLASYADIVQLYRDGMTEAARVLRPGGQLWVKCKDTIASDRQRWTHITLAEIAAEMGMYSRDLFLLVPPAPSAVTTGRWARQLHARKVHSYLWIFETDGFRRRG